MNGWKSDGLMAGNGPASRLDIKSGLNELGGGGPIAAAAVALEQTAAAESAARSAHAAIHEARLNLQQAYEHLKLTFGVEEAIESGTIALSAIRGWERAVERAQKELRRRRFQDPANLV